MLQIAIPNKGALSEDAVKLLKEAGYKCTRYSRELVVTDAKNEIDFVFLRPRDIALYVGNGIIDLGITGRDLTVDSEADVVELMSLNFGRSNFHYAIPKESNLTPDDFEGLRIACSYPAVVKRDLANRGINAKIVKLDGAVEISIRLGVADAIADVVESGRTLVEAGLKVVGESLLESEAVLIAHDDSILNNPAVAHMVDRLRGILVARDYAMVEYDVPEAMVARACELTPGIEAPTVSPLSKPNWVAVKAMIKRAAANNIIDELYEIGARGIIVTDIRTCRL